MSTTDSFQGGETDINILCLGAWTPMGCLRCVLRMCVATTRARFLSLIVANESFRHGAPTWNTTSPYNWWICFRSLYADCSRLITLPRLTVNTALGVTPATDQVMDDACQQVLSLIENTEALNEQDIKRIRTWTNYPVSHLLDRYQIEIKGELYEYAQSDASGDVSHISDFTEMSDLEHSDLSDDDVEQEVFSVPLSFISLDNSMAYVKYAQCSTKNINHLISLGCLGMDKQEIKRA